MNYEQMITELVDMALRNGHSDSEKATFSKKRRYQKIAVAACLYGMRQAMNVCAGTGDELFRSNDDEYSFWGANRCEQGIKAMIEGLYAETRKDRWTSECKGFGREDNKACPECDPHAELMAEIRKEKKS